MNRVFNSYWHNGLGWTIRKVMGEGGAWVGQKLKKKKHFSPGNN